MWPLQVQLTLLLLLLLALVCTCHTEATSASWRSADAHRQRVRQELPALGEAPPTLDSSEDVAATRHMHDIYLNYAAPLQLSYGHVERSPEHYERRFGMRDEGKRYRGKVIWADGSGGHGAHYWDLAQGAL